MSDMQIEILTRGQAARLGKEFYYTGKPCKYGHLSLRNMQKGECVECRQNRFNSKEYRSLHKDAQALSAKVWSSKPENKLKRAEQARNRRLSDPEKHRVDEKRYRAQPEVKIRMQLYKKMHNSKQSTKIKISEYNRYYAALNPEKYRWANTKRYRALLQATPIWANLVKIAEIYKNVPTEMQVDHIVPLQGLNVCGLHVHRNLQYLSKPENSSKRNKFNADEFEVNHG